MRHIHTISNLLKKCSYLCIASLCTTALMLSSCSDEPLFSPNYGNGEEVEVKVFLTVPAPSIAQTRAGSTNLDDSYFNQNGVYVLVFTGNTDDDQIQQVVKATGSAKLFYAKLASDPNAHYVCVVANAEKIIETNKDKWIKDKATLGTVKDNLVFKLTTKDELITEMINPQPMIYDEYLLEGITVTTKIGSGSSPVEMKRSTAKISIYNETGNQTHGEKLYGANLASAPTEGYLFPENSKLGTIKRSNSGLNGDFNEPLATPLEGTENCYLYTFESTKKENASTAVIIKSSFQGQGEYYYRIDLNTEETNYALLRNFNYIVRIQKIEQRGYDTAQEALENRAGNIKYTVNVVDAYSRDIISDGEYYLGVNNSEFYIYTGNETLNDVCATVVQHNITEAGAGICEITEGQEYLSILANPFASNTGGKQNGELRISAKKGFTQGTIHLKVGGLERDIKIYKRGIPTTEFQYGYIFDDFKNQGYISATVEQNSKNKIKVTDKAMPKEEDLSSSIERADENIYLRVTAYTGNDTDPATRDLFVGLLRKDAGGNAKVQFVQPKLDIYTEIKEQAKVTPYTYVGTFHRWNETGERIIRVNAKASGTFAWKAQVISGDFIRLSLDQSKDGGIGRNFEGQGDNTNYTSSAAIEQASKNGQLDVPSDYTEIHNNSASDIYFRVGLTSTLASENSQPRYGLILLTVNYLSSNPIKRFIYVRQGEAADYLMRPEDPAPVLGGGRPLAKKISPYNLTDPDVVANPGAVKESSELSNTRRGIFSQYPSQAGYLYQHHSGRGWWSQPPMRSVNFPNFNDNTTGFWSANYETCPKGYRMPNGGKLGIETPVASAKVADAEIRQILWLYPQNENLSETQNFIIGYIADGFFDRRPMDHQQTLKGGNNTSSTQLTHVSKNETSAYIGVLVFNPWSLASIFMPMAGYYIQMNPILHNGQGHDGGIWTTASVNSNCYWSADFGILFPANKPSEVESFQADNYSIHNGPTACSIRCVKDE